VITCCPVGVTPVRPAAAFCTVWYNAAVTAKQTTLNELGGKIERGFKALADDIARIDTRIDDLKTEMIDQFEHADKQVRATHDRLSDIVAEIAVIHRRVERLEELGASNAGFAKENDHLLARVAEIEKHLGIDKKIAG
jgi:septal ring factor EnvC (AmiA/AmiB activator)